MPQRSVAASAALPRRTRRTTGSACSKRDPEVLRSQAFPVVVFPVLLSRRALCLCLWALKGMEKQRYLLKFKHGFTVKSLLAYPA